ncbi:protein boule-like [Channa argus]|uniref:protein boule-like n=1 Tax=Channa argus TaxID=215402 RepID=UPI0035218DE3
MDAAMDVEKQNSNGTCSFTPDVLFPENHADSLTPPNSHFGTVIPNRIFVRGFDCKDNESDLLHLFSQHGVVKEVKIVIDPFSGISKGYGFVTFETQEEALKILHDADGIFFKDKKLSIGQAFRKPQARQLKRIPVVNPHHAVPLPMSRGPLYLSTPTGNPYTYHNGVAYFRCPNMNPPAHHWPPAPGVMLPQSYQPVYQQPANRYCQCFPNQCQFNVVQPVMASSPTVCFQQSEYLYQPADGGFVQPLLPVMEDITPEFVELPVQQMYPEYHQRTEEMTPVVFQQDPVKVKGFIYVTKKSTERKAWVRAIHRSLTLGDHGLSLWCLYASSHSPKTCMLG